MTTVAALLAATALQAQALQITSLAPQGEISRIRQVVARFDESAVNFGDPKASARLCCRLPVRLVHQRRLRTARAPHRAASLAIRCRASHPCGRTPRGLSSLHGLCGPHRSSSRCLVFNQPASLDAIGAAPIWAAVINHLHRTEPGRAPTSPQGLVQSRVTFDGLAAARNEWFIKGIKQTRFGTDIAMNTGATRSCINWATGKKYTLKVLFKLKFRPKSRHRTLEPSLR